MKMDKEALAKNRFWIGLGAFALLWLIVFLVMLIGSGSEKAARAKEISDADGALKAISAPKNASFTKLLEQKQKSLEKQKDGVWAVAWKGQKDLMAWPNGVENKASLEAGYFGDPLTPAQRSQFRDPKSYAAQLPVNKENNDVVAPGGEYYVNKLLSPNGEIAADWDRLIHRVDFTKNDKDPTDEECWLAQEDVWVQRELVYVVRAALDSASQFENVAHFKQIEIPKADLDKLNAPPAPAPGAAAPAAPAAPAPTGAEEPAGSKKAPTIVRQRFHTPHWRLDLVLEQGDKHELTVSTQTTLSGIDVALPTPGLDVRLWQNSATPPKPVVLQFQGGKKGEPLPLAKAVPLPGFAYNLDELPLEVDITADKSEPAQPEGTRRLVFRNPNWELELLVVSKGGQETVLAGESKLTNINSTQRTLSLAAAQFVVYQGDKGLAQINPPGAWLGWKAATTIQSQKGGQSPKPIGLPGYNPNLPLQVAQVFNAYTSPIVRINSFEIPGSPECRTYNSHRTANLEMKSATQFPVEEPKDASATGGGMLGGAMGAAGGGMMGGMNMPKGEGGRMGAPGGAALADGSLTSNGINRKRYLAVTDQVRNMPIALSLIIEQSQLQDLLTAVANSRLRIQITQVQWQRAEGIKRGTENVVAAAGPGGVPMPGGMSGAMGGVTPPKPPGVGDERPGGTPFMPPSSGMRGGMPFMPGGVGLGGVRGNPPGGMIGPPPTSGMGGMGGMMGGFPGVPGASTVPGDQSDPNLIEVAVYGIAALYERYPPKPPAKPGDATAAPTGTAPPK